MKFCIVTVAPELVTTVCRIFKAKGLQIVARRECFDRAAWELKVYGDQLPEWCQYKDGEYIVRAGCRIDELETILFYPADEIFECYPSDVA